MTKIEQKVRKYISEKQLLKDGQTVLVALSGGADSVCLLLILLKLGYKCQAAHCNFHLRGEESNRDEEFVTDLCSRLNVPLHKTHFDTLAYSQQHKVSIEMAARDLRYDFFRRVMQSQNIPTLAIGHHQGDNVETLLLNLTRGTGIRGLAGIQPIRPFADNQNMECDWQVVRPLLCLTHEDITTYLSSRSQLWVEDSTNQHDDVGRNIIRLNVIPELQRVNPSVVQNIISTIDNLNEVQKVYDHAIHMDIERCTVADGVLSIPELMASVSPSSVLHEWLKDRDYNRTQEQDILQAASLGQSGKIIKNVLVDRNVLVLEDLQQFMSPSDIIMTTLPREQVTIKPDASVAYLDADKLQGELTIRLVQPSDSFQPFGMKGRKLLSDFLTDRKLNIFQKHNQLVLCDSTDICWVVGLRSSECYRVDETTKRVVVVSCKQMKK